MNDYRNRPLRYPVAALTIFGFIIFAVLCIWHLGIAFAFISSYSALIIYLWKVETEVHQSTERHIEELSHRVKDVGREALLELPIGIVLIDSDHQIEWVNPFILNMLSVETVLGEDILAISD